MNGGQARTGAEFWELVISLLGDPSSVLQSPIPDPETWAGWLGFPACLVLVGVVNSASKMARFLSHSCESWWSNQQKHHQGNEGLCWCSPVTRSTPLHLQQQWISSDLGPPTSRPAASNCQGGLEYFNNYAFRTSTCTFANMALWLLEAILFATSSTDTCSIQQHITESHAVMDALDIASVSTSTATSELGQDKSWGMGVTKRFYLSTANYVTNCYWVWFPQPLQMC